MKPGDRIETSENVKNLWKVYNDKEELLNIGFSKILWETRHGREQFHAALKELHPELREWKVTYCSDSNTIILERRNANKKG